MPELPEVETIRRGLAERLINDEIVSADINVLKMFRGDFNEILKTPITNLRRIAKVLIIDFANHKSVVIHLKMTGQLIYVGPGNDIAVGGHPEKAYQQPLPHKHTHIIYSFKSGAILYYNDLRKFGWHKVVDTDQIAQALGKEFAGIDVSGPNFTLQYFKDFLTKRPNRSIKEAILEQQYMAGLGNIYAAEALWHAKILPNRQVKSLNADEQKTLHQAIIDVINLSLKYGGSSFNSYVDAAGQQGAFMKHAEVYKKKHDSLGHEIKQIKQGGRTTHYCPICQK